MELGNTVQFNSLKWVQEELRQLLGDVQRQLEFYLESPDESEKLVEIITLLRQVRGTLSLVEIYGAALLCEEIESVVKALQSDEIANRDNALEVLMSAVLRLPDYLDTLAAGNRDVPMVLLPLLNDLRACRNANLLSENVLFFPDISVATGEHDAAAKAAEDSAGSSANLTALAKKLRHTYQLGLLSWFRNLDAENGLRRMQSVVNQLKAESSKDVSLRLWYIASTILDSLLHEGVDASVALKSLMGQVDRQIKFLADNGEEAFAKHSPQELTKNILYYIANSKPVTDSVSQVQKEFKLDKYLPDQTDIDDAEKLLSGPNQELLNTVADAITEDINEAKDILDIFVHGDRKDLEKLKGLQNILTKIGDTLGMLGLGNSRQNVMHEKSQLDAVLNDAAQLNDETLMSAAGILLAVENDLQAFVTRRKAVDEKSEESAENAQVVAENQKVISTVVSEALKALIRAKEGFLSYVAGTDSSEQIKDVPGVLAEIAGAMFVEQLEPILPAVRSLQFYFEKRIVETGFVPGDIEQDMIADVVTSVEYYLDAASQNRMDAELYLAASQEAVKNLDDFMEQNIATADNSAAALDDISADLEVVAEELKSDGLEVEEVDDAVENVPEPTIAENIDINTAAETVEDAPAQPPKAAKPIEQKDYSHLKIIDENADEEILEIFIEEAVEELGKISSLFPQFKDDANNEDAVTTIRRSFHTLKGSGRLVGAELIGEFAWSLENMFNRLIDGTIHTSPAFYAVVEESIAVLPQLIEQIRGNPQPVENISDLMNRADGIAAGFQVVTAQEDETDEETDTYSDLASFLDDEDTPENQESVDSDVTDDQELVGDEVSLSAAEELMMDLDNEGDVESADNDLEVELEGDNLESAVNDLEIEASDEIQLDESFENSADISAEAIELEDDFSSDTSDLETSFEDVENNIDDGEAIELEDSADSDLNASMEEDDLNSLLDDFDNDSSATDANESLETLENFDFEGDTSSDNPDESLTEVELLDEDVAVADILESDNDIAALDSTDNTDAVSEDDFEEILQETTHDASSVELTASQIPVISPAPENTAEYHMEAVDPVLVEIFTEESESHLSTIDGFVENANENLELAYTTDALTRALHTLHGSAKTAKFFFVSRVAEPLELFANNLIILNEPWTETDIALLEGGVRYIRSCLAHLSDHTTELPSDPDLFVRIKARLDETKEEVEEKSQETKEDTITVSMETEVDPELVEIFLEEGQEIIDACEQTLQQWIDSEYENKHIEELMRQLHTLKGSARMASLAAIGDLSHSMESLFISLSSNSLAVTEDVVSALQTSVDMLAVMLEQVSSGQIPKAPMMVIDLLDQVRTGDEINLDAIENKSVGSELETAPEPVTEIVPTAVEPSDTSDIETVDTADPAVPMQQDHIRVRADKMDALVNYAGEVNIYQARLGQNLNSVNFNLGEFEQTVKRLQAQLREVEMETEAQIASRYEREAENPDQEFDPLEMDRYSHMQQLSRSLAESASDLENLQETVSDIIKDSEALVVQQTHLSAELQDELLQTRMVKFQGLSSRLRRVARQTAQQLGKKVELTIDGADTEIDRSVQDRMLAPLEHMLRNAVFHGIEKPDERKSMNKPETGTIKMSIDRDGSYIVLNIADDGRGIDTRIIREKAIERGLIQPDDDISDHDVIQFILHKGFSTADDVSQIAGRGVGMDVVDSEIKQLGGTLSISSQLGTGTLFSVRLPLTLAINQALLVELGDDVYAIPLTSIEGVARITAEDVENNINGKVQEYEYINQMYNMFYLGALLQTGAPLLESDKLYPLLMIRSGENRVAVIVDSMIGRQEVVVKPVGPQISAMPGISGATILADGLVAVILDVGGLLGRDSVDFNIDMKALPLQEAKAKDDITTVMVVDDSITIRKVTAKILERHNLNVVAAKDGVDAIGQLQDTIPDLFLMDIEMPRMDGFELATHVRADSRLKDIPIIMITSRTGGKHRERAMNIGVNRYLGKPFQENELMQEINEMLG